MRLSKQSTSCDEARRIDLVDYLSSLGFQPSKIRTPDYWYRSPLRHEKTPSFKVNRKLNRWYDHGLGRGGNLIDFAILYNNCTVGEFLQTLGSTFSFHQPISASHKEPDRSGKSSISILSQRSLSSFLLLRYLHHRRIPLAVAEPFCSEVTYELCGRKYYGLGFRNDAGGWEIRNPFFKGSSAPKDVTTFDYGASEVAVFEGFFDFLSFRVLVQNEGPTTCNFLVLNSVTQFEKARPFLEKHNCINLYLDRDQTGQNCTRYALSISNKYKDQSGLYTHYKDLNDWIMNIGKIPKSKPFG